MKSKITLILATFLAFLSRGEPLPECLPIGNKVYDYLVAYGPCNVTVSLQSTNSTRGLNSCGSSKNGLTFGSFSEYQSYVAYKASELAEFSGLNKCQSQIRMKISLSSGVMNLFMGDLNLGSGAKLAYTAFVLNPSTYRVTLPPTKGITSAAIQSSKGVIILDCSKDPFSLNSTLADLSGRLRIKLTGEDGSSMTYTELGVPILPPRMNMVWMPAQNSYSLVVEWSEGSDLTIQYSDNLAYWSDFMNLPWYSTQTARLELPISPNKPVKIFRAFSK